MRRGRRALLAVGFAVLAAPASAQEAPDGLAGLLLRFFSPENPVVLRENPDPALSHAAHFVSQPNAQATLQQLNRGIASQLSTFPLGSSSAGFTYTFDPALGVFNRSTESFGPVFSERPITAGKGKFSFGVTHLRATYDTFEGQDLGAGDMKLYLTHEDVNFDNSNLNLWFEGDVVESALVLDLKNDTTVFFANYGLADRIDVGVAIPYTRVDLDARIDARIQRLATAADPFVVHVFDSGEATNSFRESGTAEGIGDMVLRGKFNFLRGTSTNMALATDLRLPTGDADDLLGSGATQLKVYVVGAWLASKAFSPRAAAGYTLSSGGADFIGELPDEINYSAGFDLAAHSRVTLTADLIGRTLLDANRVVIRDRTFNFAQRLDPTVRSATFQTTETETGNLNVLLGSAGVKINPVGRLLLTANALFGLGDDGLVDRFTPVFGIDYSF
jgi:hypothetical protein